MKTYATQSANLMQNLNQLQLEHTRFSATWVIYFIFFSIWVLIGSNWQIETKEISHEAKVKKRVAS